MTDTSPVTPDGSLLAYLSMLAEPADPARFLEVRWRRAPARMQRRFVSTTLVPDALELVTALAPDNDVYVGVATRDGDTHGGRAAVSAVRLAYVESDSATTATVLSAFSHPPSMVVASGTPGHHQVYWQLDARYPTGDVERANRRLALALDADPACSDAARILRPPQTFNHKHAPPRPVTLLVIRQAACFSLAELTSALPEDPRPPSADRPAQTSRTPRTRIDGELLAIPASHYVRVLAGLSPNREGKVRCPFHDDHTPSLQVYPDGGFYCFGSGCGVGGSIYDFAGRIWGIVPKGAGFLQLRERLAESFDLTADPWS